jgi:hypothetical protein
MVRLRACAAFAALLLASAAQAQQCGLVSQCPVVSTPTSGAELLYIIQGGVSKQITLATLFTVGIPAGATFTNNIFDNPTINGGTINGTNIISATFTGSILNSPTINTPAISGGTEVGLQYLPPYAFSLERTITGKLGEIPSIVDFGAVAGGSATANNAAVVSANADAAGPYFVPLGAFATTKNFFNTTDITQQYSGSGHFTDVNGNVRGRTFLPFTQPLVTIANNSNPAIWLNGDNSHVGIQLEQVLTSTFVQSGTLTTTGTASGNVLTFTTPVPSWVGFGGGVAFFALNVTDTTHPSYISTSPPVPTYVSAVGSNTITLSQNVVTPVPPGDVITFGLFQYFDLPEASAMSVNVYAAPGSIGYTGNNSTWPEEDALHFTIQNNSGTLGDINAIGVICQVTSAWSGYQPTSPYLTPQCLVLGANTYTTVDNVYLAPIEIAIADGGKKTTGIVYNADTNRSYDGVANGHPELYWLGFNCNAGGSTVPIDACLSAAGAFKYGIDFTPTTIAGLAGNNDGAAIALKSRQGIFFNATPGTFLATSPGFYTIYYDSTVPALRFQGGTSSGSDMLLMNTTIATFDVLVDGFAGFATNGGTGVSCPANTVSLTTLVVILGIVTHC